MECQPKPQKRPPRPPPPDTGRAIHNDEERMEKIRTLRDESYLYIQQGLSCDEHGQLQQAFTLYSKGLSAVKKAFNYSESISEASKTGSKWESTQSYLLKMEKTKLQMESRIEALKQLPEVRGSLADPPPSYELASSTSIQDDLNSIMEDDTDAGTVTNATEIFKIHDGVQIFHITPDGLVSAPSYPSSLAVYIFEDTEQTAERGASNEPDTPPAFMKVGSWVYPLLPGSSPALHAFWGAYVFPDVQSQTGGSIGVILPDSVSDDTKSILENILTELTALRIEENADDSLIEQQEEEEEAASEKKQRTSETVAQGIVTAAEWIAWGLGKGAEKAGDLMRYSSSKLTERLQPEAKPSKIDPRAQKGVEYTRKATGAVVHVSGYLVKKLGDATMALARHTAPHIRKQGEKYLPTSWTKADSGGRSTLQDAAEVAQGGIKGWATVYLGLEGAARLLAKNLTENTVTVVNHKYGSDAGRFTEHTMYSAANLGVALHNFTNLGVKAIATRAAKDTGKVLAQDYSGQEGKEKGQGATKKQDGAGEGAVADMSKEKARKS